MPDLAKASGPGQRLAQVKRHPMVRFEEAAVPDAERVDYR
jgi:hypothetical protein